ncbi:hypothetical protein [Acetomicrobium sp. S15 = DSM 107314]|uniref:hypothetical protein n=1 Tax=Acetomicrobium sp. S15 = DSM 107314 TaxID=2529858 RepID=UPI0018E179A5|nr:hypothetical protein [Acetomicrobium sp. S15 = DSM 107314]
MAICIAGHIGVGHVFSHSGINQDDSQGFAAISRILCERFGIRTIIKEVFVEKGTLLVRTEDGGIGKAVPRRGIAPFEAEILKRLIGEDAALPHLTVLKVFGRMYGHGVTDLPVATEYAVAASVVDAFVRKIPGFVVATSEGEVASDVIGGVQIDAEGVHLALLLTINGSRIGIGPVEDLEGNVPLPPKREVMQRIGALKAPTIVVESKAYLPHLKLEKEAFLIRFNEAIDNVVVGESLEEALKKERLNYILVRDAFPEKKGEMKDKLVEISSNIARLAILMAATDNADGRAMAIAELARLISEDVGGVIFMSNALNDVVRGAGLVPGTGVVLSIAVPKSYLDTHVALFTTKEEAGIISMAVLAAARVLWGRYDEAMKELEEKYIEPLG